MRLTLALALAPLAALPLVASPALAQQSPSWSPEPVCSAVSPGRDGPAPRTDCEPEPTQTDKPDPAPQSQVATGPPPSEAYSCPFATAPGPGTNVTTRPGQRVDLPWNQGSATGTVTLTRLEPEPVQQVRSATGTAGTWQLTVGQNHVLRMQGDKRCDPVDHVLSVTPNVTLSARRSAVRQYTFTGRVYPARAQLVTLYLATEKGRTIAAQQRVGADGVYRIDRRFLGSGRFEVTVVAGATEDTVVGQSNPRPTVIH